MAPIIRRSQVQIPTWSGVVESKIGNAFRVGGTALSISSMSQSRPFVSYVCEKKVHFPLNVVECGEFEKMLELAVNASEKAQANWGLIWQMTKLGRKC